MRLRETSRAISSLPANLGVMPGVHKDSELRVGAASHPIADVPLLEAGMSPLDENHLSPMGVAMGEPHGTVSRMKRPVLMNVVLHLNPERDMPSWLQPVKDDKVGLALDLKNAIVRARSTMDHSRLYVVGDTAAFKGQRTRGVEIVEDTEDPEAAVQKIFEITRKGLSLIISDHRDLPLRQPQRPAVAVKVNHPLELEVPYMRRRPMRLPLRGGDGVWLSSRRAVDTLNTDLARVHSETVDWLNGLAMPVAQVVTSDAMTPLDIDLSIAGAIRDLKEHHAKH